MRNAGPDSMKRSAPHHRGRRSSPLGIGEEIWCIEVEASVAGANARGVVARAAVGALGILPGALDGVVRVLRVDVGAVVAHHQRDGVAARRRERVAHDPHDREVAVLGPSSGIHG